MNIRCGGAIFYHTKDIGSFAQSAHARLTGFITALVNHMNANPFKITETELVKACDYISQQFAAHSWWPREQPGEAKREFELMKGSASALTVWCERWLDAGQCQKLEKALRGLAFSKRLGLQKERHCPVSDWAV